MLLDVEFCSAWTRMRARLLDLQRTNTVDVGYFPTNDRIVTILQTITGHIFVGCNDRNHSDSRFGLRVVASATE